MFKHLLVALDGSRHSESIIPYAIDLARRASAEVTFVRVVPQSLAEVSEWGAMGRRRSVAAPATSPDTVTAERYLDALAETHARAGLSVNTELRHGDPAAQILAAADELGADTIAIATHSRRGLDRLVFGSVTERVVHGTSLPVIMLSTKAA